MKIVTVIGARPQFIKAAAVSRIFRDQYSGDIDEIIVHTGQHFDSNMSEVFFNELDIPQPKYNLEVCGGTHGTMTGRMLETVEKVLLDELPDWVLVYGDTNSTLAGALAAVKLCIPVAHVEAGLRSFNMAMPEEINRIVTDRVSNMLFCPTELAVSNLQVEGVTKGVWNVGDVMYDVALFYKDRAINKSNVLQTCNLQKGEYVLVTCHRAENTDNKSRLKEILMSFGEIAKERQVVLPLHPRAKKLIAEYGYAGMMDNLIVTEPLAFMDMIALEQGAGAILTDSGGVQKEAFFYGVPCITMRDETEWGETVDLGWNQLVGAKFETIYQAYLDLEHSDRRIKGVYPYGKGTASQQIIQKLETY